MGKEQLDHDTLMDKAAEALDRGDHEQAMINLKNLLAMDPEDAIVIYLLATVHAAMGMLDRAVDEYRAVLAREPEFHVARFQLGLIFLGAGQGEDALATWEHYMELGEQDCFFLFRRGIEYFLAGQLAESVSDLKMSIALNDSYDSIRDDMKSVLVEIEGRHKAG